MEISGLCATSADLQRACSHGHASLQEATDSSAVSVDVSAFRTLLLATAFVLREWQTIASSPGPATDRSANQRGLNARHPSFRPDLAQVELMEQASARITQLSTELERAREAHAATVRVLRSELDSERLTAREAIVPYKGSDATRHDQHRLCSDCEKVLESVLRTEAAEIVSASQLLHARLREEEATHVREREHEVWRADAMRAEYNAMVSEVQKSEEEQCQLLRVAHAERERAQSKCQELAMGMFDARQPSMAHSEAEHAMHELQGAKHSNAQLEMSCDKALRRKERQDRDLLLKTLHLVSATGSPSDEALVRESRIEEATVGHAMIASAGLSPADSDGGRNADLGRATSNGFAEDIIASAEDLSSVHEFIGHSQANVIRSAKDRQCLAVAVSQAEAPALKEHSGELHEECAEACKSHSFCDNSLTELRAEFCNSRRAHHTVSVDSCKEVCNNAEFRTRASSDKRFGHVAANGVSADAKLVEFTGGACSEYLEERVAQLSSELEACASAAETEATESRSQAAEVALLRMQLEATSRAGAQLKLALDEARRGLAAGTGAEGLAALGASPKTGAEAALIRRRAQRRGALLREELLAQSTPEEEELRAERRRVRSLEESQDSLRASVAEASRRDAAAQRWAAEEASELERLRLHSSTAAALARGNTAGHRAGALALRSLVPQAHAARMEAEELCGRLREAASAPESDALSTKRLRSM